MKKFSKFKIIKILFYNWLPFFSFVACMVPPFFFCSDIKKGSKQKVFSTLKAFEIYII